ncbi:MAG: hypothetical protein HC794_06165 [Nitrospiraceae bacterium]|nr:hypothetical protein [Nitrospiraceae bacterium]
MSRCRFESGGGIRSASATLGQIRALVETGFMERVAYISCVSGGSWTAVPYTFAADGNESAFLGRHVEPEDMNVSHLTEEGAYGKMGSVLAETKLKSWLEAFVRFCAMFAGLQDSEWFGKQLERSLLEPLDLNGRDYFITQDARSLERILMNNPALESQLMLDSQVHKLPFRMPAADRPFLIANGTIRRYDTMFWKWSDHRNKRMPLEMTPLYVGVPHRFRDVGEDGCFVGGNYVEPVAYGAKRVEKLSAPENTQSGILFSGSIRASLQASRLHVESGRFNLSDMIAISGAALADYAMLAETAFPKLYSWSHFNSDDAAVAKYQHSDGGLSDNLGLMALLSRRVTHVVAFVNAEAVGVPDYVRAFFGDPYGEYGGWRSRGVFPQHKLSDLEHAVTQMQSGLKAPYFTDTYKVHSPAQEGDEDVFNVRVSPSEDYSVTVTWCFLESSRWERQLDQSVSTALRRESDFKNFPRFKTFMNNPLLIIDPTPQQVNVLSFFSGWVFRKCVEDDAFRAAFGLRTLNSEP